jgi:hypothetical protein
MTRDGMKVGRNEEINEEGREGLRMQRNEEGIPEEEDEFGVLHSGRRYKRLKTGAEKGESCSEYEKRVTCAQ